MYSLIDRDIHGALVTIEQVSPVQVPRRDGVWVPEASVVEFSAEKTQAAQTAADKGQRLPDGHPATLYDAIVKDYTGRTREAQDRTLIITHLNADRRALNSLIHDERQRNDETGRESVTLPVLVTASTGLYRKFFSQRRQLS